MHMFTFQNKKQVNMGKIFGYFIIILNLIGIIAAEFVVCGGCVILSDTIIAYFEVTGFSKIILSIGALFLYLYIVILLFQKKWSKFIKQLL